MSDKFDQDYDDATEQESGVTDQVKDLHGWSIMIGAVIGIVIGLIIGWVIWPVHWTEAWPSDLDQEAKAQYLAAVAQVYSYDRNTEGAVEQARMKLFGLNDDMQDEIDAAMEFFDSNPTLYSNLNRTNLALLAQGLGVTSDEILAAQAEAEAGAEAAAEPAGEATDASSGGGSALRWLFSILLVILLIGGGIYILLRLARRGPDDEFADVEEEYDGETMESKSGFSSDPQSRDYYGDSPTDEYSFEQETNEELMRPGAATVIETDKYEEETFFDDASATSPATPVTTDETRALAQPTESDAPPLAPAPDPFAPFSAGKVLDTFMIDYQAGEVDFERAHTINDPATNEYIGECGVGVNVKSGILNDIPENVIALDAWLYDKKQDNSQGNRTRILLSEYAIDHNLEQAFIRQMPDAPTPVVAQPGVSFQLIGTELILDCEVLEVTYTSVGEDDGIFQNLKVELTVRTKD